MQGLATLFYIAAYLLAVEDGVLGDKGNYPSSPGRTGLRLFLRTHPWIALGAVWGVAGVLELPGFRGHLNLGAPGLGEGVHEGTPPTAISGRVPRRGGAPG